MHRFLLVILSIFTISFSYGQEKKLLNIKRATKTPKIDGVLDDDAWQNTDVAENFIQFRPALGMVEKVYQKSIVKITYDDNAIYFGAYLHDKPENIMRQFTSRDNFGQSDFFGVVLNPNNDAQNDTEFFVFSSGTQADAIANPSIGEDFSWNAVWTSAVKIVDDGWIVEMKIPYSALRFTNNKKQVWGLNFHRHFRSTREQYAWNPIDITKGNIGLYHGEIHGIENIEPPTRLSFYPFASVVYDSEMAPEYNFGMDVKYGISENFTLDATLIPDFSQAGFDNLILNLGPFEQRYNEQRQFFTEGVDLFTKSNLFYSRRIGNAPTKYYDIEDNLADDEEIIENPEEAKLLNAVKVSGRTKKGLGVGFFNAITEKTEASIKNLTTDKIKKIITEPLTNYNIVVLDQQFNKNSSAYIINTNVTRNGHFRDANVTSSGFDITNKKNSYNYYGSATLSSVNEEDGTETGFSSVAGFGKVSGKYRFTIEHELADRNFDKNDFGILYRNNYNNINLYGSYRIFEPTKKLNNFHINTWIEYKRLFKPSRYAQNDIGASFSATTRKLNSFGGNVNFSLGNQHDYFEPRDIENNRYFTYKNWMNTNYWVSTNYNKTFAIDTNIGCATLFEEGRDYFDFWFGVSPRLRPSEKLVLVYSYDFSNETNDRGYVYTLDNDDILFGERDRMTIINSITGNYNFNTKQALTLTFRNYWTTVDYQDVIFKLQQDGKLNQNNGYTMQGTLIDDLDENPNINYDIWNLDLKYTWEFAPGSFFTALYRNQLFNSTNNSKDNYIKSLKNLFKEPIQNIFSIRMIYYIDYNNVKKMFKKG